MKDVHEVLAMYLMRHFYFSLQHYGMRRASGENFSGQGVCRQPRQRRGAVSPGSREGMYAFVFGFFSLLIID